jgi:hypothetical protein
MDSGDPNDPDKVTSSHFASVQVKMVPNPPPAGAGPAKAPVKPVERPDSGEGSVVESVKTRSTATFYSTEVGARAPSQARAGGGSSKRASSAMTSLSAGAAAAGPGAAAAAGAARAPSEPPVERALAQLFTNKDCSWGFEKLFDLGEMFDFRAGYITGYGEDRKRGHYPAESLQDGAVTMTVEILAAAGIRLDPPRADGDLTPEGRSRVYWPVHNLKRLVDRIGPDKRLSSAEFACGDDAWYQHSRSESAT